MSFSERARTGETTRNIGYRTGRSFKFYGNQVRSLPGLFLEPRVGIPDNHLLVAVISITHECLRKEDPDIHWSMMLSRCHNVYLRPTVTKVESGSLGLGVRHRPE
jgi:hypothetical protein